jgi:hypothetical protein
MASVFEHALGWTVELDGRVVIGEYVGDECPLTAAVRAHAIDRDHPVRIETADGVVIELDFLSFGDFHQDGDPQKSEATGKARKQRCRRCDVPRSDVGEADW